jgi:NAD(P)-dependent dehydrogenase (short-subunit alcohol dehydrogenase family)
VPIKWSTVSVSRNADEVEELMSSIRPTLWLIREKAEELKRIPHLPGYIDQPAAMISVVVDVYGGLDILHNNAAIPGAGEGYAASVDDFSDVTDVDLQAPYIASVYAVPEMKKRGGGSIIITGIVFGGQVMESLKYL